MYENLLKIAFALLVLSVAIRLVYASWFNIEDARVKALRRQEALPQWYPLRNYAIKTLTDQKRKRIWVWFFRSVSIALLLLSILLWFFLMAG